MRCSLTGDALRGMVGVKGEGDFRVKVVKFFNCMSENESV